MRRNRIGAAFLASLLAGIAAAPALAQTPYDGQWQVTIVTNTGSCEPTASSMLTLADGKMSASGAKVSGSRRPCESLDQRGICQRPNQWQFRFGEVEWSFSRHTM